MRYFIISTAVVLAGCFMIFAYFGSSTTQDEQETFICIPLSEIIKFDPNIFAKQFNMKWKTQVICEVSKDKGLVKNGETAYLLGDGTNKIRVTVGNQPVPSRLIDTTILGNQKLTDADKDSLRKHKAYILVHYPLRTDKPTERARFTAKILLSLLQTQDSLGYMNASAMLYTPEREFRSFFANEKLEAPDLFTLFIGVHLVDEGEVLWLHTHGMEQFGSPDLQVRFKEKYRQNYYWELLSNASVYMINKGPVLKPGDTAELKGDGIIYKLKSGKKDTEKEFGAFGSLEIVSR
jgi:hypothetical protein